MIPNRITTAGAVIAAWALTALTGQAFLFEDGTFETRPDFEDGSGWEAFGTPDAFASIGYEDWANGAPGLGGAVFFPYSDGSDGQFGLAFKAFSATEGGFYHDVPVDPLREYVFWIQSHVGIDFYDQVLQAGGSVSIDFAFYNGEPAGGGALVSTVSNDITAQMQSGKDPDGGFGFGQVNPNEWDAWEYTNSPPPTANWLRTIVQWTSSVTVTGGNEAVRWDNAELTTSLDPFSDATVLAPVLELTFQTQTNVTHTVEESSDPVDTNSWADAGLPLIVGNDQTQQVYTLPEAPVEAYRLFHDR